MARDSAQRDLLPHLWFRNTWSWGDDDRRPKLTDVSKSGNDFVIVQVNNPILGEYRFSAAVSVERLFTENETNTERI